MNYPKQMPMQATTQQIQFGIKKKKKEPPTDEERAVLRRQLVNLPPEATEEEVEAEYWRRLNATRRRIVGLPMDATDAEVKTAEEARQAEFRAISRRARLRAEKVLAETQIERDRKTADSEEN